MDDNLIKKVVVLGGGTAGWMTAAYLGKALQGNVEITVLEAPSVPRIGVGEATVPNLQRVVFDFLGIPEDEWMRECNASFKTAVKFINWRTPGEGSPVARQWQGRPDHFYHPFGLLPSAQHIPLSHYWARNQLKGGTYEPFDYACFREPAIMDAMKAPRYLDGTQATYYAWHFDAALVADFLRRFATKNLGVVHVQENMTSAEKDSNAYITALRTEEGHRLDGDLFVDCSGFRGLLINEAMNEPFIDMNDHLLCDSAVATPIRHDDAANGIEPYTSAIAMKSGWTWRTPLLGRFGSGYVYSSQFASQDEAIRDFCTLWQLDPEDTPLNKIRFRVGRNRRSWVKNVVSVGLSSCFLEPLESTGIFLIYAALYQLAKHFPDRRFDPVLIDRFNRKIDTLFDETRDFLQAHFYFSPRTDTEFWRANKELTLTDSIKEKVAMYKAGVPVNPPIATESSYYSNFDAEFENFWTNGSYYCIFAGLGVLPDHTLPAINYQSEAIHEADALFLDVKQKQRHLVETLPSNYEYLLKLHAKDMEPNDPMEPEVTFVA
ncbi:tryptophan halogenase [Mycobacterium marinum]|uniref:tryptophan halogenase family protein n=1 Tax=Mycobacterium marinum TaxID=1781 RepID=UPI000E3CBE88|nr:tryptophan halogenase family protein [Mycobacterium marinum]RFZ36189.1 Flavin-dependent tryptophan halogenase RebH [Mycobacterium marinum]GJO00058.1 tryptophan halogenase [Mycobacterium marinum]GJO05973.1 tryptophan halogenase [Mycobacterium marinum]GJO12376.1 tryptophan halogenase [Mycobacterium marinum]GJO14541.1 tryptophan halogenase [Mycobacterium marinum]